MKIINLISNFLTPKALAQTPWGFPLLPPAANPTEYGLQDVLYIVGNIINILLILAGSVAVIYIIVGGYRYIISAGKPESIQQAKDTIFWAVIGFIICLAAFAILRFAWAHIIGGSLPEQQPTGN